MHVSMSVNTHAVQTIVHSSTVTDLSWVWVVVKGINSQRQTVDVEKCLLIQRPVQPVRYVNLRRETGEERQSQRGKHFQKWLVNQNVLPCYRRSHKNADQHLKSCRPHLSQLVFMIPQRDRLWHHGRVESSKTTQRLVSHWPKKPWWPAGLWG